MKTKLTHPLFLAAVFALVTVSASATNNTNWFKIVALTTQNAVFADASLAGSLAASANHLLASRVGDSEFRRWDANGLTNPTNFPSGFIIVSDLRTEKVYAFADASGTMTDQGTATELHELDPATGQTNGVVIPLSASVAISSSCGPEFGIFCGWGRVVVGRSQLADIALPSGQVTALGKSNPFNQGCDPSEPLTGVAEFFGNELYLVACQRFDGEKFERVRLSNGDRTTLASFPGLPSRTKLTFSPSRNRWYFSTANSWLNNSPLNEGAVGYADASWDQSDVLPPPPPLTLTLPSPIQMNEDTTNNALVTFTQSENAGFTYSFIVASSNPALLPTNTVTFPSGGVEVGEAGNFNLRIKPLPNQFGAATLTLLTTNQIGGRATNTVVVQVASVGDAPEAVMVEGFSGSAYFVAQAGAVFSASFLGTTLIATNGVVRQTNVFSINDPDGHATGPTFSFATDNPTLLPLAGFTLTPLGTNYQLVVEAAADVFGSGQIYVTPTDADGVAGVALSFRFGEVKPAGIRRAETVLNTDFRVFAQGGLRNLGSLGATTLSVTGLVGTVQKVWLYTHSIGNDRGLMDEPMLSWNGTNLFNLNTLTANALVVGYAADSCETTGHSVTRRFDLTGLLTTNGLYTLTKTNPFNAFNFSLNGISLLVFYDDGNTTNNQDVTIFHGNDSTDDGQYDASDWQTRLKDVVYGGGPARLGLHVAYGEAIADAPILVNGNLWQPQTNHFDGLTVPGRNDGTNGFFWDLREFDLTPLLNPGTNTLLLTMHRANEFHDCLNLVLATVAQPPATVVATRPQLTITPVSPSLAIISWTPTNSPGFVLQQSDVLVPAAWTNSPSGSTNPAAVSAVGTKRFYRLNKP